jgi:spermidine synthase
MENSQKRRVFILTLLLTFFSGVIIMSYEIITARLLSPLLGSSIYTWTAAIGMVLAGMTIGVWLGGWASKNDRFELLPVSYVIAGITIGGALLLQPSLRQIIASSNLGLPMLAIIVAGFFAFIQTLTLSFAGPLFIERITYTLDEVGPQYSALSVAGSLGSIIGVFIGGFVLVPLVGITPSIILLTIATFIMAFLSLPLLFNKKSRIYAMVGILITFCIVLILFITLQPHHTSGTALIQTESPYYTIHVYDKPFQNIDDARWLFLDFDSHSIDTHGAKRGTYTDTAYMIPHVFPDTENILVLGAGAYTIPKTLATVFPDKEINVIEIDPKIESIGKEYFDVDMYENITTHVGDPRYLLPKSNEQYDLIFNDIYQSFISVPAHLVTTEFLDEITQHLTPDGIYMMSFIATDKTGVGYKVAQHMIATIESKFTDVRVLFFGGKDYSISSFVVIASQTEIPYTEDIFTNIIHDNIPELSNVYFTQVDTADIRVFTDNWQPLDTLMRPLMKRYFTAYKNVYYDITNS